MENGTVTNQEWKDFQYKNFVEKDILNDKRCFNDFMGMRNQIRSIEKIVRIADIQSGDKVLEIGCGMGFHLDYLKDKGVYSVGIDLVKEHVLEANERSGEIRVMQADAENLPFRDGAFDHVIGTDILHHLPDPLTTLKECKRVAERVTFIEPNCYNPYSFIHGIPKFERGRFRNFKKLYYDAGLKDIKKGYFLFIPAYLLIKIEKIIEKSLFKVLGGKFVITGNK